MKAIIYEIIVFRMKEILCFYSLTCLSAFSSLFLLQEKLDLGVRKDVDGMGTPDIKYGDSVCYIQHVDTCLWLTYQTVDAKCARMGGVQRKVPHQTITSPITTL